MLQCVTKRITFGGYRSMYMYACVLTIITVKYDDSALACEWTTNHYDKELTVGGSTGHTPMYRPTAHIISRSCHD